MKDEITLSIWEMESPLLLLGTRSRERRDKQRELILAVLQAVDPRRPTRDKLQSLTNLRRGVFIRVLKRMIEKGEVMRYGRGVKNDPFTFGIAPILSNGPSPRPR